jgi:hypothetical protein
MLACKVPLTIEKQFASLVLPWKDRSRIPAPPGQRSRRLLPRIFRRATARASPAGILRRRCAIALWVPDPVLERGCRPPARPAAEMHWSRKAPRGDPAIDRRTTERGDSQHLPRPKESRCELQCSLGDSGSAEVHQLRGRLHRFRGSVPVNDATQMLCPAHNLHLQLRGSTF